MNEVRYNPLTGRAVIHAPDRRARPSDVGRPTARGRIPRRSASCPFCPGNEARLAPLIEETPGLQGAPWQTRVVMNKYPLLTAEVAAATAAETPFAAAEIGGRHEVIIEHPRHDWDLAASAPSEAAAVIETCRSRFRRLAETGDYAEILIFRNRGPDAGTSLTHPHGQLVAMDRVSPESERRRALADDHAQRTGRCLLCDLLAAERREGLRMVLENRSFAAFVPFAAETRCEIWLVPEHHDPAFGAADDGQVEDLAAALRDCLGRLKHRLDDPPYNYVLLSETGSGGNARARHWFLRMRPRASRGGGFELGTGLAVRSTLPEADAELLRR